ncbi:hypothetical protein C6P45_004129 [Maudiozyma exigua]|uniref:GDS1 winged helix domain-containing protein n=1 Tax=Maudiozyma exigua TaxID=34358 RepID=A0A9P6WEG8_MAUEX|nr:hypothetical protein C6P45_004129 [Kazachstania exigua]
MENEMLHNSTSPIFQLGSLNLNSNSRNLAANNNIVASFPGSETVDLLDINPVLNPNSNVSLTTPKKSSSVVSLNSTQSSSGKSSNGNNTKPKKDSVSAAKKDNPLMEVSKLIPVTGERPVPEDRTAPLNDDVLFAVFVILCESDVEQNGLTVKQLCDFLLAKHPEMSNLSTKLSNLISAKLNAYVKKVEKGEKTMKYAISREWSNSSPRRMLYVYRGILAPDYKEHAKKVTDQLKQQIAAEAAEAGQVSSNSSAQLPFMTPSDSSSTKNNKNKSATANAATLQPEPSFFDGNSQTVASNGLQTMDNLINQKNISMSSINTGFSLSPGFNIPYSSSPVSVTLNQNTPNKSADKGSSENNNNKTNTKKKNTKQKTNDLMTKQKTDTNDSKKRSNENMKGDSSNSTISNNRNMTTPQNKKQKLNTTSNIFNGSGSNSATITPTLLDGSAASSAIGVPIPSTKTSSTYVTAVAATPRISKLLPKSGSRSNISNHILHKSSNSLVSMFHQSPSTPKTDSDGGSDDNLSDDNAWLKIVREGFLTKDIQSPESISLEELDSII